jgi:hypothetical protein
VSSRSFRRERARQIHREKRRAQLRARKAAATGALIGVTALLGPAAADAATTFTVDNTNDTTTAGACDPGVADDCSLRQAINDANSNPGADVVSFSGLSGNLITLTHGQINVTDDIDIQGPGAGALTISGDANSNGQHDLAQYGDPDVAHGGDSRIFQFGTSSGTTAAGVTASVSGLTLSGGTSGVTAKYVSFPAPHDKYTGNNGGAIISFVSNLTLSGVTMTDNQSSDYGGAIATQTAGTSPTTNSLTITDSDLSGNESYAGGGAVDSGSGSAIGSLTLSDSEVTGNQTLGMGFKYDRKGQGGAILAQGLAEATITGSTISNNDATDNNAGGKLAAGGGVYLKGDNSTSDFQISDTTISGNTAVTQGGGAYLSGHDVTIERSSVAGNTVSNDYGTGSAIGGGVFARGDLQLTDSTVSGNQAENTATAGNGPAGGLYWHSNLHDQGMTVESSTISGNQSSGDGGGVFVSAYASYDAGPPPTTTQSGPVAFRNSTIDGNTGATGGIFEQASGSTGHLPPAETLSSTIVGANSPDDLAASTYSAGFEAGNSLIQSDVSGIPFTQNPAGSDVLGVNPQLGPLQDNGGPTDTRLPAGGSPAVDAGIANGLTTDQRGPGFPRTVNDPNVADHGGSDGTDIGAAEAPLAQPPGAAPPGGGPTTPTTPPRKKCKKHKHGKKSASAAKKKCKKKRK